MSVVARFQKAVHRTASTLQMIAGIVILVTAIGVTLNAFARYGFGRDIAILTEAGGYVFLFVIFFGLAGAFVAGSHISVEILSLLAPKRVAAFMYDIVVPVLSIAFVGVVLFAGVLMTLRFYHSGKMTIGMFPMPFWIFMAIVPVGCAVMELALISSLIDNLRHRSAQDDGAGDIETL